MDALEWTAIVLVCSVSPPMISPVQHKTASFLLCPLLVQGQRRVTGQSALVSPMSACMPERAQAVLVVMSTVSRHLPPS